MNTRTVKNGMVKIEGSFFAPRAGEKQIYSDGDRVTFEEVEYDGKSFRKGDVFAGVLNDTRDGYTDIWYLVEDMEVNKPL